MLRFSFAVGLALALLDMHPAVADSFWSHNGSEMRLRADGSSRTILYEHPRPGIAAEGVEPGTVLFQGSLTDGESGEYSGTAFIFSERCGKRPFEVTGSLQMDGHEIHLNGAAPRIDRSTCQLKGTKESPLIFKFVRSDEPPRTSLPMEKVPNCSPAGDPGVADFDKYKDCLEKEANRICRGITPLEDLVKCFNDAMVLIYKKSGMTGYATDFVEGDMIPFTSCKSGVCRRWGGGSSYSCVRLDPMRIRECEGFEDEPRCNEISCPVRQCRKMCSKAE